MLRCTERSFCFLVWLLRRFLDHAGLGGVPGVSVTADSTQTSALTLHGDHLFFNGFPEGDEGGVMRLAQWIADCDLNLDGTVTNDELQAACAFSIACF